MLRLYLHRDPDGTAELVVAAASGDFAGRGTAWFTPEQIAAWGRALELYPLRPENPPLLEGGYWEDDGRTLRECHVRLRVVPRSANGTLEVEVQLAAPLRSDQVPEQQHAASLTMATEYDALRHFARAVVAMAEGKTNEAQLCVE
jgi:hypothetical protein